MNQNMIEMIVMIATIIGAIAAVIGTFTAWRKRKGGGDDREKGHHIEIKGKGNEVQTGESNINIKNNKGKINIQR